MCRPQSSNPCLSIHSSSSSSKRKTSFLKRATAGRTMSFIERETEKYSSSAFLNGPVKKHLSHMHRGDIGLSHQVGQGSFSDVHSIESMSSEEGHSYDQDDDEQQLVIKHLREDIMSKRTTFHQAAAGLFLEGQMLCRLDHPNIINIHGWAKEGLGSFGHGTHDGFFLILDHLDETMSDRLQRWQQQGFDDGSQGQQMRLDYALQLASALSYLHDSNLIFRDLKPDNIGFKDGTLQLFDFGLCRELPSPDSSNEDHTDSFIMSGVGSRRYMAPEIVMGKAYNQKADVYSLGVIIYEMMTLRTPFDLYSPGMYQMLVCEEGLRPNIPSSVGPELTALIQLCWAQDPSERPTMAEVKLTLQTICTARQDQELLPNTLAALSRGLSDFSRWLSASA